MAYDYTADNPQHCAAHIFKKLKTIFMKFATVKYFAVLALTLSISFSETIAQISSNKLEKDFCKPLNKKIIRTSFTYLAFGKVEKTSPDSYSDLTYKTEEADESVNNGSESAYTLLDQISDLKVTCIGNTFSVTYRSYIDDQGNTGVMSISGTISKDGKMLEDCSINFAGTPGTGKYRKEVFNYSFKVKNIPSEANPAPWKRTYQIDNFEKQTDIFSDFKYFEKYYNGSDYYLANNMLTVDQSNKINRFSLSLYFVK